MPKKITHRDVVGGPIAIDPDLLRAFLCIVAEGSFTRAAARLARTQSAISMQVQRLETLLGQQLVRRSRGGAVALTAHGRLLLGRAAEMVSLNDAIWGAFHAPTFAGSVRLGTPEDYALRYLPPVLARFAHTHPAVQVEVISARSEELVERLKEGELDLMLIAEGAEPGRPGSASSVAWAAALDQLREASEASARAAAAGDRGEKLRLGREGDSGLQAAGRHYRIACVAGSQALCLAPVQAGLAVTISAPCRLPEGVVALRSGELLPALPELSILLVEARRQVAPAVDVLADYLRETFREEAAEAAQSPALIPAAA